MCKKCPRLIALSFPGRVHEFSCILMLERPVLRQKINVESIQPRRETTLIVWRTASHRWKYLCVRHALHGNLAALHKSFSFKGFVIDLAWPPALLCSEEMIWRTRSNASPLCFSDPKGCVRGRHREQNSMSKISRLARRNVSAWQWQRIDHWVLSFPPFCILWFVGENNWRRSTMLESLVPVFQALLGNAER